MDNKSWKKNKINTNLVGAVRILHEWNKKYIHWQKSWRYQSNGECTYCSDGWNNFTLLATLEFSDVDPAERKDDLKRWKINITLVQKERSDLANKNIYIYFFYLFIKLIVKHYLYLRSKLVHDTPITVPLETLSYSGNSNLNFLPLGRSKWRKYEGFMVENDQAWKITF